MLLFGLCTVSIAAVLAGVAGCAKPLFPENQARSPYERYRALRGDAGGLSGDAAGQGGGQDLRQRLRPLDTW